jgi:hypothetical protein|tara:strand:- start:4196 stop:5023 length:828 start_codon:yes stop_codon:yes gene_type:complete
MCLGAGLLAGAGAGAGAAAGAGLGFGAAASAGSALGFGASAAALAAPAISFAAPAALSFGAAAALPSLGLSTIAPLAISPFSAPLTGATGLFGLGSATKPFLLGQALNLGTNIFSAISQRNAIFQQVRGIYDSSLRLIANAEQAKADQERAINELLQDKLASKKQQIMTAKIQTLQAKGAIVAAERAGNTINLLLQDAENQGANVAESILQESDTITAQAIRDKNAVISTRDTRRNAAKDQITQATNAANQAPTLLGAITKSLGSGLTQYASLVA